MLATTEEANEYRKKFHKYYYEKIAKDLAGFEEFRLSELRKYNFWFRLSILAVIIGVIVFIYCLINLPADVFWGSGISAPVCDMITGLTAFAGIGCYLLALKDLKNFERKIKEDVIQSFLSFFGDFRWSIDESISKEELEGSGLTGHITKITGDDYFEGTYKNTKIIISEVALTRGSGKSITKIFDGLFIKIGMNKTSEAHTIVIENMTLNNCLEIETCWPSSFSGKEKITLEDPEFEKTFKVFSNNQIEARFILTTAFMQRLKNLKKIYRAIGIRVSIQGNSILIALPCERDMFFLGDLRKPVTDTGQMQTLFEEFLAVLSLVDILNLTSKTGL